MSCINTFKWIKLYRDYIPSEKGILNYWTRLAVRVAYHDGFASYCGHKNTVHQGSWVGGIVGLKSIFSCSKKTEVCDILAKLEDLGYITYSTDNKGVYSVKVKDIFWLCDGKACKGENVYASSGYGFICVPRNLADKLVGNNYKFEPADALLDLWCHTVYGERNNIFSMIFPSVRFGEEIVLTLDYLGKRWNWEKSKVSRFFKKYSDLFTLRKLPSSFGCVIFNCKFPARADAAIPSDDVVTKIAEEILAGDNRKFASEHERFNSLVLEKSNMLLKKRIKNSFSKNETQKDTETETVLAKAVAVTVNNLLNNKYNENRLVCSCLTERYRNFLIISKEELSACKYSVSSPPVLLEEGYRVYRLLNRSELSPELREAIKNYFSDAVTVFVNNHPVLLNLPF